MNRGFSLVELSIVLVILGLLTGGILAGQSLIRASELRSVVTSHQRYSAAITTFRDEYAGFPGDFEDATRFWGRTTASLGCTTNSSAAITSPGSCDGNGDQSLSNPTSTGNYGEIFLFWQHLAYAGLIEGKYTGYSGSGGAGHSVPGTNVPAGKISNSGWSVQYLGNFAGTSGDMFALDYGNTMIAGLAQSTNNTASPMLKPEEAWNIDTKLDDGKPAYGRLVTRFYSSCTSGAVSETSYSAAVYNVSSSSVVCALYFVKIW